MYTEDELIPISALQHLAFCERQAALIHVEGQWQENRLTVEGEQLHERVHEASGESRGDLRIARGLRLRSFELGLTGVADVVEFHRVSLPESGSDGGPAAPIGQVTAGEVITLPGIAGLWQPYIIEYKHGAPKIEHIDEVQLCGQAMCLEEMLGVVIHKSAFFYGRPRRRQEVNLEAELRQETAKLASALHVMVEQAIVPPPQYASRCERCSLIDVCLPKLDRSSHTVSEYLTEAIRGGSEK
ncbi:MAG: CRISPR-associated protein Cas4 [Chloroflexi bacterium]|nr:CRISPR-associated protein Cas4 [Chloroflexota bacterium]